MAIHEARPDLLELENGVIPEPLLTLISIILRLLMAYGTGYR
jgi:hypothetical protein